MSNKNNKKIKQNYKDIADAIRAKTGSNELMTADEMPEKISEIETGIEPEGTKQIRNNGEFNIREFEKVNVDVPGATTKELFEATKNGTYDIAEYANVKVDVPNPSTGNKQITTTEQVNVTDFATAQVVDANLLAENIKKDVSILGIVGTNEGYPEPTGKAPTITSNGTNINIKDYAAVDVNVPNPSSGILEITENGNYDVSLKASVEVDVPAGITPSGSLDITENGNNIDVTDKATVNVNVPEAPALTQLFTEAF